MAAVFRSPEKAATPPKQRLASVALLGACAAALALVYGLGHLNWYLATPLGRVPVLDERENLDLAEAISQGSLPAAPFYRSPGYALVLACLRWSGISSQGLFPAALLLGVCLHGLGAWLVTRLAGRWFGRGGALAAGIVYALNPVLVHFATQALDATLGLVLFLWGLCAACDAIEEPARVRSWATASIAWALAVIVRPNYLLVWATLGLLALRAPRTLRRAALASVLAGLAVFAAASAWQWRVCGKPGFLPWQGAYNLWAANRPGANGRYYTQKVSLPPELARGNPARAESVLLYDQETSGAPAEISLMNAHWRGRFVEEVTHHPLRWGLLMARKSYALLNNFEQYNNKTYSFHKARSPWLSWNPVCFGLLLALGVAGGARLAAERPELARGLGLVGAACAASVVLFFVSARFRLPLAAMLTALGAGALARPLFWMSWKPARRALLLVSCLAAVALAFSRAGGVADTGTYVQDHVLLARAAFTVGDDALALKEAHSALEIQPWHPDAKAIERAAISQLSGKEPPP